MNIPLTEAKARLTELVRRAEAGEEVVLTRHGEPAAVIVPVDPRPLEAVRKAAWERARASVQAKDLPVWPDAAHAADFHYGWDGLPA